MPRRPDVNQAAAMLGRKGGLARARKLSAARRKEIAKKASLAAAKKRVAAKKAAVKRIASGASA